MNVKTKNRRKNTSKRTKKRAGMPKGFRPPPLELSSAPERSFSNQSLNEVDLPIERVPSESHDMGEDAGRDSTAELDEFLDFQKRKADAKTSEEAEAIERDFLDELDRRRTARSIGFAPILAVPEPLSESSERSPSSSEGSSPKSPRKKLKHDSKGGRKKSKRRRRNKNKTRRRRR